MEQVHAMASTSTDDSDAESESTSGDESYFDEEGTEMEFEEDEDGESVNIDSILDITPVNSRSADVDVDVDDLAKASTSVASRASSVQSNDAGAKNLVVALSSSTPADVLNRDAFSSTSNDSDGSDPDNGTGAGNNIKERKKNFRETYSDKLQSPPQQSQQQPQSEWDKALLTGKESKGRASDFFLQQHPVASTDSLGLYSTLQAVRATTPGLTTQTNLPLTPKAGRSSPLPILRDQIDVSAPQTEDKPILPPPPRPQTHTSSHSNASAATISSQSVVRTGRGSTLVQVQTNMGGMTCHNHVPLQRSSSAATAASLSTASSGRIASFKPQDHFTTNSSHSTKGDLSAGVLPDVLMSMRQKIESMTLFDSDILRLTANSSRNSGTRYGDDDDPMVQESRESLKRSSQQSISAAVLVSLAHKRYERRRLAAMEIEKVVRSLVVLQNQNTNKPSNKNELDRVRAILLLLSDDYVRSTSEDARKGGVVALAACAIGLKKAHDHDPTVQECRDLILASVVHACQDHSQRVRYYATESLFNVVKVIPSLAVQHFFILFEVLRSLFADVDSDVRSGAELLDKKLKEVIVGAMNAGIFAADQCVPVFARFVYIRNKATKRLTLTWLQELNEKLIGSPILEFLHLFLGGVIEMVADPSVAIRQSALAFLQSVLPKLIVSSVEKIDDDHGTKVDFDKILQSLVTTMEHANPFVRKVAMYWMFRIVKAHMKVDEEDTSTPEIIAPDGSISPIKRLNSEPIEDKTLTSASISVRNSVPHLLPGVLLSVGDDFVSVSGTATKDSFLPDQTTRSLAEQTNACLQTAVRRDGRSYIEHLDGFIVALREEMASSGGLGAKHPPAIERSPYRMDVLQDGTGIETAGWFRSSRDAERRSDELLVMSRLCALHWVIILYDSVVPDALKADYAREFVFAIIQQLQDNPPGSIVYKSLEVLARITVPVVGEEVSRPKFLIDHPSSCDSSAIDSKELEFPINDASVNFAMNILQSRRSLESRDREVFAALIQLHAENQYLMADMSDVITFMCKLQPPEFVMVSFAVEVHRFILRNVVIPGKNDDRNPRPCDLKFVSSCIQHLNHVLFNTDEARPLRDALKDCISTTKDTDEDRQRSRLFSILLYSFSHNIAATLSLCLWVGAYRTAFFLISRIDPLDINLMFLLEVDLLVEMLERPLFRHLHIRMLERDLKPIEEGSGIMLFQFLKNLLMILPQSPCYRILRDRLVSVALFRKSTIPAQPKKSHAEKYAKKIPAESKSFVERAISVRSLHCKAAWQTIRQESLEDQKTRKFTLTDEGADRRDWLGYASKQDQLDAESTLKSQNTRSAFIEDAENKYHELDPHSSRD